MIFKTFLPRISLQIFKEFRFIVNLLFQENSLQENSLFGFVSYTFGH